MQVEFRLQSKYSRFIDIFIDQVFVRQGAKRVFKKERQISFSNQKQLQVWLYDLELKGSREYAYLLLSYKSYPSDLLKKKLFALQVDPKIIQAIMQELIELRYLNDEEWIERFIEKLLDKGWGPYMIVHKLKEKNIQDPVKFVEKIATTTKQIQGIEKYVKKRGKIDMYPTLVRRGFSISVIEHWQESRNFL